MKKLFSFLAVMLLSYTIASAAEIKGKVVDSESKGLIGATIRLLDDGGKLITGSNSTSGGAFSLKSVKNGSYKVEVTFIGYETVDKKVTIRGDKDVNLGTITLKQAEIEGETVVVEAMSTTGELIKDTTQFNAKAFKTAENAVAEDLIKKIPGVEVASDGTVKAQGETVKKVLVDGKPFFGDDPKVAMKNLPADMIEKVQIYDKNSDNSEFKGKEDDEKEKAINIITKRDRRKGVFGNVAGGYGSDNRYSGNLVLNVMNDQQRYTILGMSNNVSIQNFSMGDIMSMGGMGGGMMSMMRMGGMGRGTAGVNVSSAARMPNFRGGPSDFMVDPSAGISTNHSVGINFSDVFGNWGRFDGSYFFNLSDNSNTQNVNRNYFAIGDSSYKFNQGGEGSAENLNHRVNARFSANIDSSNSIMIAPYFTYQNNEMKSYSTAISQYDYNGQKINDAKNDYMTNYSGFNFDNDIVYVHKFKNPRRNISLSLNNTINNRDGYSQQKSQTTYYLSDTSEKVDQRVDLTSKNYTYNVDVDYVEPISDSATLRVYYRFNNSSSELNNDANSYNEETGKYDIFSNVYSSVFSSKYTTNTAGVNYRLKYGIVEFGTSLRYQLMNLHSDMVHPRASVVDYNNANFLPSVRFRLNFSRMNRLGISYFTWNMSPRAEQLSEVLDRTNPLQLYIGNADLKPTYSNNMHLFYMNMSDDFKNVFNIFTNFSFRNNYIANAYYTAAKDTTINNVFMPAGSQLYRPINMDGYFDSRLYVNYSFPIDALLMKLSFGGGASYNSTPGLINGIENTSNNFGYNATFGINSNVSKDLDYNLSTDYNYNFTKNTNGNARDYTYKALTLNADLKWTMFWGIYVSASSWNLFYLNSDYYTKEQNAHLLNLAIGVKFLENNAAQLEFKAFDVLNKNSNLTNNITDRYTEIISNNILRQYFLLTFTYNLRIFGGMGSGSQDSGAPPGMGHGGRRMRF